MALHKEMHLNGPVVIFPHEEILAFVVWFTRQDKNPCVLLKDLAYF